MKNPFPGMNPFIEGYKWSPFHLLMIARMHDVLMDQVPAGFMVEAETTLYIDDLMFSERNIKQPDISLMEEKRNENSPSSIAETLTPPTQRERYPATKVRSLHIRDIKTRELVTSIELLSPTNKRGLGLERYRSKRDQMHEAYVNLVEIDLLRGGERPGFGKQSDYAYLIEVIDENVEERLKWEVGLFERLPTVPVPLRPGLDPLALDLQAVFQRVFNHSALPYALSYDLADLRPPIEDEADLKVLESYLAEIK